MLAEVFVRAVCKLEWVWDGVDVCHEQPFKELQDWRLQCDRAVVIVAGSLRVLGNWNDGGRL